MESQRPVLYGEASMLTHLVVLPSQSQFSRKSSLLSISPPSHPGNWCSRLFIIRSFGWKVGHRHEIRNFSLGFSFWTEGGGSSGPTGVSHWLLRGSTSSGIFVRVCSEGAGSMSSGPAGTVCHGSWEASLGNEVPGRAGGCGVHLKSVSRAFRTMPDTGDPAKAENT